MLLDEGCGGSATALTWHVDNKRVHAPDRLQTAANSSAGCYLLSTKENCVMHQLLHCAKVPVKFHGSYHHCILLAVCAPCDTLTLYFILPLEMLGVVLDCVKVV
jgi:hypothetical protein